MTARHFLRSIGRSIIPNVVYTTTFRPAAKKFYSLAFGRKGCKVDVGGTGVFRLSPDLAFRGWESFGDRHNSGFVRCIDACKGKSVFIDVGAHVGLYSLPASRVLEDGGSVYAFEPDMGNYRYLVQHIGYNRIVNITAFSVLVGDKMMDEVPFFEYVEAGSGMSGLTQPTKPAQFDRKQRAQICLDDFCGARNVVPDVIKVDVEGAELLVLQGAETVLRQHQPLIFLSIHPSRLEMLGQSVGTLTALLHDLNYELTSAVGSRTDEGRAGEYLCVPR